MPEIASFIFLHEIEQIEKLRSAIRKNDSEAFLATWECIDFKALNKHGGLPTDLLDLLIDVRMRDKCSEYCRLIQKKTDQSKQSLNSLLKPQGIIARKLLEYGFHIPLNSFKPVL